MHLQDVINIYKDIKNDNDKYLSTVCKKKAKTIDKKLGDLDLGPFISLAWCYRPSPSITNNKYYVLYNN